MPMKILYAIQSTGNGHLSRAIEILPALKRKAEVDILVSGPDFSIEFPFYIDYRLSGLGFTFGKNGGINFVDTWLKSNISALFQSIMHIPVEQYDLVINDFEPVSAWACHLKKIPCIGLSNQSALLHPRAPKAKSIDLTGRTILKYYAPASLNYGFHYTSFDETIFTPVIRKKIRESKVAERNYYTVYLPAFEDDKIVKRLQKLDSTRWELFSKNVKRKETKKNVTLFPATGDQFIQSMAQGKGVITAAGFGSTTEAMFLSKKLLVIPQKSQFEQQYNGAVLKNMGVTVIKNLKKKRLPEIEEWLNAKDHYDAYYPDQTDLIVDKILAANLKANHHFPQLTGFTPVGYAR
jgi:uncharacterized protein (TIGR00661 family)